MGIESSNPTVGQQTSTDSVSVVLATDQPSVNVNVSSGSVTVSGPIALDSATLSALESITVQNPSGAGAVNIQDGGNSITVDGSVSVSNFPATQNVNVTSSVLPTGAATETTLSALSGKFNSLGQKTMVNSAPVVLSSDQSAIPVTGPLTNTQLRATPVPVSANQSGTWNITNISGTVSLPTGAATSALQTAGNTSLSSIDGKIPSLGQTTMAGSAPVVIASNQSTINVTNVVTAPTYRASTIYSPTATTATDIFTIYGSATKKIQINSITFTNTQTTAGVNNIFLIKRSTANSNNNSTVVTSAPLDSVNASATAVVRQYTGNPSSVGTQVAAIGSFRAFGSVATALPAIYTFNFGSNFTTPLILNGTAEGVAINLNSASIAGISVAITVEWSEV